MRQRNIDRKEKRKKERIVKRKKLIQFEKRETGNAEILF
jgi:hypothetical protein